MEDARGAGACYAPRVSSGRLQAVAAALAALSVAAAFAADPVTPATAAQAAAIAARTTLFVDAELSALRAGLRTRWSPRVETQVWFGHGGDFPADALVGTTLKTQGWSASLFVTGTIAPTESDGPAPWRPISFLNAQLSRSLGHHTRIALDVSNVFDRAPANLDYFVVSSRAGSALADDFLNNPAEPRAFALRLRRTF